MGSRTQILKCKVLLKGIEFDLPLCKELKVDWKLPKNQFSIFSVIRKIKNRIENCPKPIFICLKLLKIENWIENCGKINFHFFEITKNWTKMKWMFLYTDDFKTGMEKDIFVYFNFISKLKIEKGHSFFNFQIPIFTWKLKNKSFVFRFSIFILFQNTKLLALSTSN